ncbi:helix-turn-helix domain-containing protein [Gottfriedia sp. NPDC058432]|uniref:helix-turn-helix domain-containing protein n=1 Tax=Gottfriedia sp. NPDC058432 TaxID=3346497 RepID=UPI003659BB2C
MNTVLYQKIQHYMQKKKWNQSDLSKNTGIHFSDISRILNHKQSLSLKKLDEITKAFGLKEGSFYSYFVQECLSDNKYAEKRTCTQFLYKCAVYGFEKEFHELLRVMMAETSPITRTKYMTYIFSVAEKLFAVGKKEKALPLYEKIIENTSDHFSEQLAISHFRKFYMNSMTEEGEHALTYVLEHLPYMPRGVRREAYLWITAGCYRRQEWKKVLHNAQALERISSEGSYYGIALMYKSFALMRLGAPLDTVLTYIDQYAQVNEFFADIAVGNRYIVLLDYGRLEYVDEYLIWLEGREDLYVGLPRVLEAYVFLSRLDDATRLIERFPHVIEDMAVSKEPWLKQKMYWDFRYAHALYWCKRNQFSKGLDELLDVAEAANQIRNMERLKQCLQVYWEYRSYATIEHEVKYKQLLSIKECN